MAAQVSDQLSAGVLRPRWMPDFNLGWGEPTLNYYPPGLAVSVALVGRLLGGRLAAALFLVLALSTAVGAAGTFLLGRALGGTSLAGFLAATAFALAPYRFFSLWEAGLSSAFAAGAILPWLLLATHRLLEAPEPPTLRRWLLAYPLLYAAICWTNLPAAVLAGYLVGAVALVETASTRRLRPLARLALAGGLGALLAAEHLLPAALELSRIYVPTTDQGRMWQGQFVFQADGAMPPGLAATFARIALVPAIALAGALLLLGRRGEPGDGSTPLRRQLAVTGFVSLLLATPLSAPLWRILPALSSVNLPWRLLDPLSLAAATLAGAALAALVGRKGALRPTARLAAGALFLLLGFLAVELDRGIARANGAIPLADLEAAVPRFRQKPMFYFPVGAKPVDEMPAAPLFDADRPAAAGEVRWGPVRRTLRIVADAPTSLRFRTWFFPGWRARLEGTTPVELPVSADPRDGALVVKVPAGDHRLVLEFATTPLRRAGAFVSLAALLLWLVLGLVPGRFLRRPSLPVDAGDFT